MRYVIYANCNKGVMYKTPNGKWSVNLNESLVYTTIERARKAIRKRIKRHGVGHEDEEKERYGIKAVAIHFLNGNHPDNNPSIE